MIGEGAADHGRGWELTGDGVAKTFIFDSFRSAMLFVERIGDSTEGASKRPATTRRSTFGRTR